MGLLESPRGLVRRKCRGRVRRSRFPSLNFHPLPEPDALPYLFLFVILFVGRAAVPVWRTSCGRGRQTTSTAGRSKSGASGARRFPGTWVSAASAPSMTCAASGSVRGTTSDYVCVPEGPAPVGHSVPRREACARRSRPPPGDLRASGAPRNRIAPRARFRDSALHRDRWGFRGIQTRTFSNVPTSKHVLVSRAARGERECGEFHRRRQ